VQERGVAPPLSGVPARHGAGRRLLLTGAVALAVLAADQVTKTWAVHRLGRGSIHVVWKLDLQLAYNTGAAFSLAQGWAPVLAGIAALAVVGVAVAVRRVPSWGMAVTLGLVAGGALGNLADRIVRPHGGGVVDFIALHFWPTFNIADASIVVGAMASAVLLWRRDPGT